jgi:flagellar biosynthetic protein FliQ
MGADQALFLLNQLLWIAAFVSAPILGATLIIGLIISIVQVATQIQEITLSYVPSAARPARRAQIGRRAAKQHAADPA